MRITYDEEKRRRTLEERGLDFARAGEVFDGPSFDLTDARVEYGEVRQLTFGVLDGRNVAIVWTLRGEDVRRIISMRHVHERELGRRRRNLD